MSMGVYMGVYGGLCLEGSNKPRGCLIRVSIIGCLKWVSIIGCLMGVYMVSI